MKAIDELNKLINKYDFPLEVLEDVNNRVRDNQDENYIKQQVRYLENVLKYAPDKVKLK